jgi:hypothetical protein
MMDKDTNWRKSSYSNGSGECVEVGQADGVRVRDTRDRDGTVLAFDASTWRAFSIAMRQDDNNR